MPLHFSRSVLCLATILILTSGLGSSPDLLAQTQRVIFPNQEGQELLLSLQAEFSPLGPLDYGTARDSLFLKVWRHNDSLEGQYSGYRVPLPLGVDPTDYVFALGINTEHLYPQSKGAENGNARADMHHLYPTREDVNSDRGSLPFAEIPDLNGSNWYYRNIKQNRIPPPAVRDLYSEGSSTAFEPREQRKGDIARAMMYFYTIYRAQALNADPRFFDSQVATLCDWIVYDPVDTDEAVRSARIAGFQGNENPFVLDCSLAARLGYCPGIDSLCSRSLSTREELSPKPKLQIWPQPADDFLLLTGEGAASLWELYDAQGKRCVLYPAVAKTQVARRLELPAGLTNGVYLLFAPETGEAQKLLIRK